ncbi:hypothetical protein CALVIDRAFT_486477 [Calocera viscosa TUFC12733]|uniref:Uncharacterized protein n=1 Tax=Calocera viscosa (strain TUFC12733) TaxID=1330018 RepID=A0A167J1Y9_CALVF|nr:hypothetical protein CALVIDRAFT_486477 [Calocera viscosa TUFC12733]
MTPPLTPPNPQYIPTPAASRASSPPPTLSVPVPSAQQPPRSRISATLSRTASFASLASVSTSLAALPLPVTKASLPLPLSKRHRRLTALLVSATLLLCALAYSLLALRNSASLHLLPLDIGLLGHSPSSPATSGVAATLPYAYNKHGRPKPAAVLAPLVLSPEQELAALVAHLASVLDTNSLPAEIDPSKPIDPDYLLGFDTRGPDRETVDAKVQDMVTETWISSPVVVFTKEGPRSREVINILSSYGLTPAPLEIPLDDNRPDARLLRKALARLTAGSLPTSASADEVSLPLLLLAGQPVHRTVSHLHQNGELRGLLREAGVRVGKNPLKSGGRGMRRRMSAADELD